LRHPILNTLPGTGEARNLYLDQEIDAGIDALRRQLALEKVKARIGVTANRVIVALSARSSDKGKSKAR
jgi:hypothetical protein